MEATETMRQENGINLRALKETVGAIKKDPALGQSRFHIHNQWMNANHNCSDVTSFYGAKQEIQHKHKFELRADEPPILAGADEDANPAEHLLHALASCLTTSIVAHAAVRGIHIDSLESEIEGDIDLNGYLGLDDTVPKGFQNIRVTFKVKSDADLKTLKELAEFSPVYNSLKKGVNIDLSVEAK